MAAMKREVSTTQLKEMELQCEVYYREINRCAMAVMEGDGCTALAFNILLYCLSCSNVCVLSQVP